MATDYSALLTEYPEIISLDQLYRICHISKRKAVWLLEHQHIPCQDSGKKTWRFKIKTADVVKYLEDLESNPRAARPPVGIFSSQCNVKEEPNPISQIPETDFRRFLRFKWAAAPDALRLGDIAKLTGYTRATIGQWICRKRLQSVSCPDQTLVAKKWLITFIAHYTIAHASNLSATHRSLANEFLGKRQVNA